MTASPTPQPSAPADVSAEGRRRILLLAYQFPPIGGAGAQRNTKLARYLPAHGWDLTVVTGPAPEGHRWAPVDPTMEDEIPAAVSVHRVPGPEPEWSQGWRRRAERWLRLRWPWQTWWEEHVVPLALEVGRDADVVYASLAPFATANAAATIAQRLRKPLIVDLEDPWVLDEMMVYETGLHRVLERRAMHHALRAANGVVMNTPESEARVRATFPDIAHIPLTSILNGYDVEDFTGPRTRSADGVFRVVHTGTLHSETAPPSGLRRLLGGSMDAVNVRSRSLAYFLPALQALVADRPELEGKVELHLAGRLTPADREVIGDSQLVREHGFLSHPRTVELLRSADLLFLPMHDVPEGRMVAIVPCKTYEYLGSQAPILAAVPDGDARNLLEQAGHAWLCRPTDVDGLKAALAQALDRFEVGAVPRLPKPEVLERVERRALTSQLASFLDEVLTHTDRNVQVARR